MIIVVTGVTGSGKTDTCYAVLARKYFPKIVFIESDLFTAKIPFNWNDERDIESVYQMMGILINYHVKRGEKDFIITLSMPLLKHYHEFIDGLGKDIPLMLFCLQCEKDEVLRRIHKRGRIPEQRQRESASLNGDFAYLDDFIARNKFVVDINNTKINEEQVAGIMIEIIEKAEAKKNSTWKEESCRKKGT